MNWPFVLICESLHKFDMESNIQHVSFSYAIFFLYLAPQMSQVRIDGIFIFVIWFDMYIINFSRKIYIAFFFCITNVSRLFIGNTFCYNFPIICSFFIICWTIPCILNIICMLWNVIFFTPCCSFGRNLFTWISLYILVTVTWYSVCNTP